MKTPKPTIAEQIQQESKLRSSRLDEMPIGITSAKVMFNEDALLVHPDLVFTNPNNSRKTFDAKLQEKIDDMEATMRQKGIGVLEPILVRVRKNHPTGLVQYEAIAGDCRLLAARQAELKQVPIIVRNVDDRTARRINLIENLHRSELSDADMGVAFLDLKRDMQSELDEFLVKAQLVASDSNPQKRLDPGMWEQIKRDFLNTPTWVHQVVERALEQRERGLNRAPKVTWEDVALEVGFSQVRSIHYYIAISKLTHEEMAEDEDEEAAEPDAGISSSNEGAQPLEVSPQQMKTEISQAITSGELSQQQARALTSLAIPEQKVLLDAIRKEGLTGSAAQKRSQEMRGSSGSSSSGSSSGLRGFAKAKDALSQLSELSLPSEQIRAAREARENLTKVRVAIEGRFSKYGAYDAESRMNLRAELKLWKQEAQTLEDLLLKSAHSEESAPQMRLVG